MHHRRPNQILLPFLPVRPQWHWSQITCTLYILPQLLDAVIFCSSDTSSPLIQITYQHEFFSTRQATHVYHAPHSTPDQSLSELHSGSAVNA
jgi:hypothetical protein